MKHLAKNNFCNLGDVATYINGYAFKPTDWGTEGLPIIRIQDLTGNSYQANCFSGEVDNRFMVHSGDILISWSASLGVFEWHGGDAVLNQHIFKVVFDKIEVDKRFFIHQLKMLLERFASEAHGATMKHLTRPVFNSLPFYAPPLMRQQKIASVLERVSNLITFKKQQLAKLDQLAKSRFIEMFGDPVTNPKGWQVFPLDALGELNRGVSKARPRNTPDLLGGIYPLVQTGEVSNSDTYITKFEQTYSEKGLAQSRMWQAGTLCITIAANIAQTAILTFDACFPDSVVGFIANNQTRQLFIHYWFKFFQKILEEQAPQVAQKNINLKILKKLQVIVPPRYLQNEFCQFIEQLDKSKVTIRKSIEKLETTYRALLQEYFG